MTLDHTDKRLAAPDMEQSGSQGSDKPAETDRVRLVVAIVNYRTAGWTIKALEALAASRSSWDQFHVSVVDNDSQDDSSADIAAEIAQQGWQQWVTLTQAERNGGFAYGCNLAAITALKAGYTPDYLLLHNPDAQVATNAISELVDFMDKHPQVGISGSRILNEDGTLRPSAWRFHSAGGELDRTARTGLVSRLLSGATLSIEQGDKPQQVDWVTGAALLIRRETVNDIGWMDEGYFLYYEETDWCLRALRAGWECWQVPASQVTHCVGQSTQATGETAKKRRVPRYMFESRRRFFSKNQGCFYARIADLAWLSGSLFYRLRSLLQWRAVDEPPKVIRDFLLTAFVKVDKRAQMPTDSWHAAGESDKREAPPLPDGSRNCNPAGVTLLSLLWEDFATYDRNLLEPGLWAVWLHRLGNWRMGIGSRLLRAPLTLGYRSSNLLLHWFWGIKLDYIVKLGRRVRIWHHGGMVLGAREIGNDVHIRQNTTFGVVDRRRPTAKPVIGNGVEIGAGAVIVGDITIGHHSLIAANSLVNRSTPAYSVVAGVPAAVLKQRQISSCRCDDSCA